MKQVMFIHRKMFILFVMTFVLNNSSDALSNSPPLLRPLQIQQQARPMSLNQIQDLIRNSTPDAAIAIEIQRRGIDFQLDSKIVDDLRKLGAGAKTIGSLETNLKVSLESEQPCQSNAGKIVVLVANFKSIDDTENNAVTELILDQLREATREYQDIDIQAMNESITAQQGRDFALAKGREKKATIVLWGWYKRSRDKLILTAHFELSRDVPKLTLRSHQETQVFALPEIESFTVQTQVSKQMTYLTLLATGLARFEVDDYDGAIDRFTKALHEGVLPEQIVGPSLLFFIRGSSYVLIATVGAGAKRALQSGVADLRKAVELDPEEPRSHLALAYAYFQNSELEKALASANKVIGLKSDEADKAAALCLMVAINRRLNLNEKADVYAALAIKTLEYLPPSELKFFFLSQVYLYSKDLIRAVTNLDQASRLATCTIMKGTYGYLRGVIYASVGSFDKAITEFDGAIRMLPDFPYAYWLRGHAYFEKKQYDRSISDYSRAIILNSDIPDFYDDRGDAYEALGKWQEAIADYKTATEIAPSFSIAFYDLGLAYSRQEQVKEAIENFSRYIKLEPGDFDGYRNRAQLYEKEAEYDLAITDLKTALEQTKDPQQKKLAEAYIRVLVSEKDLKEFESKRKGVKPQ
jgi:tetratricopeptide (TPR) repeat protein